MPHEIAATLVPGDLVFDVGANVGDKAEWFIQRGLRVVCVEPQPLMVERLKGRFDGNRNVAVVPKGLGIEEGTLEMSISTHQPTLSTFAEHWKSGRFAGVQWDSKALVEVTTLDALVALHGVPRYCKIDVEGFEREVISGLTQRIGIVSFEFTNEYMDEALAVVQKLIRLGYSHFNLSLGEADTFHLSNWATYYELVSMLHASRLSHDLWGDIYAN